MPAERRSLRSNSKSDTSSSANGEKARSNSQSSSSNKDKAAPNRAAASKAKSTTPAASANNVSNSGMGEQRDQPHTNGVNGSEDVEMGEDMAGGPTSSFNTRKDRKGDEKMTVVVPPSKGSRLSGEKGQNQEEDVVMEAAETDSQKPESEVDPKVKAIQGSFLFPLLP